MAPKILAVHKLAFVLAVHNVWLQNTHLEGSHMIVMHCLCLKNAAQGWVLSSRYKLRQFMDPLMWKTDKTLTDIVGVNKEVGVSCNFYVSYSASWKCSDDLWQWTAAEGGFLLCGVPQHPVGGAPEVPGPQSHRHWRFRLRLVS